MKTISHVFKGIFAIMVLIASFWLIIDCQGEQNQTIARNKAMKSPAQLNAELKALTEAGNVPSLQCSKYIEEHVDDMTGVRQAFNRTLINKQDIQVGVASEYKEAGKLLNVSLTFYSSGCTEGGSALIRVDGDTRQIPVRTGYRDFTCNSKALRYKIIDVGSKGTMQKEVNDARFLTDGFIDKIRFDVFDGTIDVSFNGDESEHLRGAIKCLVDRISSENNLEDTAG